MKTLMAGVLGVALLGGGSFLASGEPVDPNRPDCPGQVECPRTGELVCKDRCPVLEEEKNEAAKNEEQVMPACPMCH